MILLKYSILVLLLLVDDHICSSSADQQTDTISDILKLYSNAYTSNPERKPTSSVLLNKKVKRDNHAKDFTAIRSEEPFNNLVTGSNAVSRKTEHDSVHNDFDGGSNLSEEDSDEGEHLNESPNHVIPFSEHDDPKEPQTRPNYTIPGEWAKPPENRNISLDFVPSKLYAQVRGTHTVKRLPREEAVRSAETDEEKENAARLKEVVKISKSNTVYTEEGYEDAAYDHAGQIRDANFHEGYAKKLKENLDRKIINPDDAGPTNIKELFNSHKEKSDDISNLNSDYSDKVSETIEEARIVKQQITPRTSNILKTKLKEPFIEPKTIVQDSILQLEQDLKKISYEDQTTEPYYSTTPSYVPTETESIYQNKIEYETTTLKPIVYTIKPRKFTTTMFPKTYLAKIKRTSLNYPETRNNNNYKNYTSNSYKNKPTTVKNGNLFWRYFLNKNNDTPTYSPEYFESQTVNPIIANPLAVATVNGHGPYLVVDTDSPNIFTQSHLASEDSGTTINHLTVPANNVSKPTLTTSFIQHNPFLATEIQNVKVPNNHMIPLYAHSAENRNDDPKMYKEKNKSVKNFKLPTFKSSPNHAKVLEYLQNEKKNYVDYYRIRQPSKPSYALVTYPNNLHEPYSNGQEHLSITRESLRPIKSVYDMIDNVQRPRIEPTIQESVIPVTRLLPPSPLSGGEYKSFHVQGRMSESMSPAFISIMPIIAAIHNYNKNKISIPFLYRKKRSLGPSREWEVMQREQRLKQATQQKNSGALSSKKNYNSNFKNYPTDFVVILNEAPKVVSQEVDKEITKRFKNNSKGESEEESEENSSNESYEDLNKSLEESTEDVKDSNEKNVVRVGVPELDFSSVYEEDEIEPTTVKPNIIDIEKYPFYENNKVSKNNALKYIVNPIEVPKKTFGGMEFYNSRNLECDEIDPNLDEIVPEEEELAKKSGPRKSKPKLHGLGDKVDCYKAKYFDENPWDNPLFFEEVIEFPSAPSELDPKKFASRISQLPPEKDEYIISRGPKYPEEFTLMKQPTIFKKSPRNYNSESASNYNYDPRIETPSLLHKNQLRYRNPSDSILNNKSKKQQNKSRPRLNLNKSKLRVSPAYQREVYEDVMGTIMNLDNMYETPTSTHIFMPLHSKYHVREYNNQEYNGFDKPKKQRETKIDGLVPPPQYVFNIVPLKNNKMMRSNWKSSRIFKRSTQIENIQETNNTSNHTNNVNKMNTEKTFRIVITTPISEKSKRKRKTVSIVSDELTTQRPIYIISDKNKSLNGSMEELGKYDKFIDKTNLTSSIELRRREPRYNISKRSNAIKNTTNIITSSPLESIFSTIPPQFSTDPSFSRSTLIPVIVKPDANFTVRIPQESQTRYTKKRLENINNNNQEVQLNEDVDNSDQSKQEEKNLGTTTNQYLVHENIQEDADNEKNVKIETNFTVGPDSQEHPELVEFLKGDPPGYTEAFKHETTPVYEETKSNESLTNEESKIKSAKDDEEEDGQLDEEESSTEVFAGENTSGSSDEDPKENRQSDKEEEETSSASSRESDSEPFKRYSSRPFSPSENYEDERYSELGPRINKPYFYHPPFEVPEYEKHVLGKSVEHPNDDDWNHSEETEDHETYVFPWENDKDEDDEKNEESQYYSVLGKYEYPWERRERKERERRKRERLQKKYGKNYLNSHEDQYEDEEATNTNPIFVSLKNKHSRNKKDVNNVNVESKNLPIIKFSSKYKSRVIKDPLDNKKMLATISKSNEVGSIIKYYQNTSSFTPNVKSSQMSEKSILNDKYSLSTTTNLPNNKSDLLIKTENTTSKSPTILKSSKSVRTSRTALETGAISSTKRPTRIRSRKTNTEDNDSISDKTKLSDQKIQRNNLPIRDSKVVRRRTRNKDNSSTTTSTSTKSPIKLNSRIRNRSTTSTTSPSILSMTTKTFGERRRRPVKIKSNVDNKYNLSKTDHIDSTTLKSMPTSTGRTIEHHSRVSKEEIITKTFYPDGDEEDEEEDDVEENSSKRSKNKASSEKKTDKYFKIKRRSKPNNDSQDATKHATKKETVEKVTITMEETPNHVYRTKEIDRDGIKGKFITITANNNSEIPSKHNHDLQIGDAEMEEMKRRMNAISSFNNINQDTEDLVDDTSEINGAENYVVGNLLQKLPLPTTRESKVEPKEDIHLSDHSSSEEYDDVEDNDDDKDDNDDDNSDDDNDNDNRNINYEGKGKQNDKHVNDHNSEGSDKTDKREERRTEKNGMKELPVNIIKDPNSRRYFYVEER